MRSLWQELPVTSQIGMTNIILIMFIKSWFRALTIFLQNVTSTKVKNENKRKKHNCNYKNQKNNTQIPLGTFTSWLRHLTTIITRLLQLNHIQTHKYTKIWRQIPNVTSLKKITFYFVSSIRVGHEIDLQKIPVPHQKKFGKRCVRSLDEFKL